ncbi:MAG TPA: hypothetical protein VLV86_09355 [Vicinamibacterales bacterium]|nr:hypothetical protein [Vicinamibacterales bacterium]
MIRSPNHHFAKQFNVMKLFVEPMNVTVVDVDGDGRVNVENEGWSTPTFQERRAILYAAEREMAALAELVDILQKAKSPQ